MIDRESETLSYIREHGGRVPVLRPDSSRPAAAFHGVPLDWAQPLIDRGVLRLDGNEVVLIDNASQGRSE